MRRGGQVTEPVGQNGVSEMSMHVIWERLRWSALAALPLAILTILGASAAWAGSPIDTGYFGTVAIKGYDPVAYFTDGRAVKGSDQFAYEWLGATWEFANAEHKQTFAHTPRVDIAVGLVKFGPKQDVTIRRDGNVCHSGRSGVSRRGRDQRRR